MKQYLLTVNGNNYQCSCGCNVFHKGEEDYIFICNACENKFISVKVE